MKGKNLYKISLIVLISVLPLVCFAQKQKVKQKEQKQVVSQQYPIITKDGVKFVYEGKATKVEIAGSFNYWTKQPLKKEKENLWSITLKLAPGKHQYKFVIDEKNWITDPKNPNTITTPDGFVNSLVVIYPPGGVAGPQITKDGVKFIFYAPQAKEVYLAGDFNNWADNVDGVVSNKEHLMTKRKDGVWEKTIVLSPGKYKYKFVVDGNNWFKDPFGEDAMDEYDNSIIKVLPYGVKSLGPEILPTGEVRFTYYAPNAQKVCLSGEFNNWSTKDAMVKDPITGVWEKKLKLEKGEYKYKFIVDGEWLKDPFGEDAYDEYDNSIIRIK